MMTRKTDLKNGSGSGNFSRGKRIKDLFELRKGQLLIVDDYQFNATNVAKVVNLNPHPWIDKKDIMYMIFVNPKNTSKMRSNATGEFAVWDFDVKRDKMRFYKVIR